jgi:hypothetical protein
MITRAQKDSNYQFIQLPDTKRQRKLHKKTETIEKSPSSLSVLTVPLLTVPYENDTPNITITYIDKPIYNVNIDFDEAHNEWVKNKVKLQNGFYKYKKDKKIKINALK